MDNVLLLKLFYHHPKIRVLELLENVIDFFEFIVLFLAFCVKGMFILSIWQITKNTDYRTERITMCQTSTVNIELLCRFC